MANLRRNVVASRSTERREQNQSWLTRSTKFIPTMLTPRSAPAPMDSRCDPAPAFDKNEYALRRGKSNFRFYQLKHSAVQSTSSNTKGDRAKSKSTKAKNKPRAQAAMQSQASASDAATATASELQVEVRTEVFHATLLWERIVSHLERHVKPGRHSYGLRSYENCFPGHKVVDTLMGYLNTVLPRAVKKTQARLLGQKLMLTGVIVDARNKDKSMFRENRLYRFTGSHFWDPPRETQPQALHRCGRPQDRAEGGVYRSISIENIHGLSGGREQKRKSSGRGKGYTSDSTLASSSLSKRVVQVKSSRGGARLGSDKHGAKSQLTSSLAITSTSSQPIGSASAHVYQSRSSQKSKIQWFKSESSTPRDKKAKHRTSTIAEEPIQNKIVSYVGSSIGTDSQSERMKQIDSEPSAASGEGLSSPQEPAVSLKHSASGIEPKDSVLISRDSLNSQKQDIRQRVLPTRSSGPKHCSHSFSDSASNCSTEHGKGWVVYGYV